jgi:hypothetical protein
VGNGTFDYAVTVSPGGSASALVASQNPSIVSSNVTFTATVSAVAPAPGAPTGNVVFAANGTPFSTNLLVGGSAKAGTASLAAGTNTVTAQYGGDANFLSSAASLQQVMESPSACSQTNAIVGIAENRDGTFTLTFAGTPRAAYYLVATPDLAAPGSWSAVAGSVNTVTNSSGLWSFTVTNTGPRQFYRSVAVQPCQ